MARQNQQTMNLAMDPFLSGVTDHARQESGDSGLSISSMPQTPDLFSALDIDDSMDCTSGKYFRCCYSLENEHIFIIFLSILILRKRNSFRFNEYQFRNYR